MSDHTLIIRQNHSNIESKLSFQGEESFFLLCKNNGIRLDFACGGKGICGKCKIKFLKGAPLPSATERKFISADKLREGWRLACLVKLSADCEVEVPDTAFDTNLNHKDMEVDIIESAQDICWDYNELSEKETFVDTDYDENDYFITVDLGTTTIVMEKRSIKTGKVINVFKELNRQRVYGADVVSRMEASINGKKEELKNIIEEQIMKGICYFDDVNEEYANQEPGKCHVILIAGNTVMQHILMGYDCDGLGKAPFKPVTLNSIETVISGIRTILLPGFSAFVGADLYAGVNAIDDCLNIDKKDQKILLIDLGTNAEIVLIDHNKIYCTATAAGPAFDGGLTEGNFGSDLILAMSKMYENQKIDEFGTITDDCEMDQKTIRELQLAKAAVACGIDMLLEKTGHQYEDIDKIYLAGGFGYYLNADAAIKIGLLPRAFRNKTKACGNLVLPGLALYYKNELLCKLIKDKKDINSINLAMDDKFNTNYVNYINLPSIES